MGWRLLHQARKISRQVSLALSLLGMAIIGLISLGQPWVHFQVPLRPPGHPDGSLTMPINTILFVRCPDISCLHEYDQNACKACLPFLGLDSPLCPRDPSLPSLGWSSLPWVSLPFS